MKAMHENLHCTLALNLYRSNVWIWSLITRLAAQRLLVLQMHPTYLFRQGPTSQRCMSTEYNGICVSGGRRVDLWSLLAIGLSLGALPLLCKRWETFMPPLEFLYSLISSMSFM